MTVYKLNLDDAKSIIKIFTLDSGITYPKVKIGTYRPNNKINELVGKYGLLLESNEDYLNKHAKVLLDEGDGDAIFRYAVRDEIDEFAKYIDLEGW